MRAPAVERRSEGLRPQGSDERVPHISVCICTYKRPALIGKLLEHLERQNTSGEFTFSVVVTENSTDRDAEAVVARWSRNSEVEASYWVEPERNIARARNTAIRYARGDFVAFIDDDELPGDDWLLTLYRTCEGYGVAGVLGPVLPRYESGAPTWVAKSGLFDRPSHATGFKLTSNQTRTGNALVRRRAIGKDAEPFDSTFLAASDQIFFRKLMKQGHEFVWCNEAPVYELVPRSRWRLRFLVRRALFRGVFSSNLIGRRPLPFLVSAGAVCVYVAMLPFALFGGRATLVKYLFKLCYHMGRLMGLVGLNPVRTPYVSN